MDLLHFGVLRVLGVQWRFLEEGEKHMEGFHRRNREEEWKNLNFCTKEEGGFVKPWVVFAQGKGGKWFRPF